MAVRKNISILSKNLAIFLSCRPQSPCFLRSFSSLPEHSKLAESVIFSNGASRLRVSNDRVDMYIEKLKSLGFPPTSARSIVLSEPNIFNVKLEKVSDCYLNWCTLKIPDEVLLKSLSSYPKLLLMSKDAINKRCNELLKIFAQKDLIKLLKTCPRVFFDDFNKIYEKVQYIVHKMGIDQKVIVKAEALKHDLKFISLRHTFLVAAGKYKKPGKKVIHNPHLSKILHKDVQVFLQLSGLTEEEYNVFCEIYDEFFDESDEEDSETEREDDDDDD